MIDYPKELLRIRSTRKIKDGDDIDILLSYIDELSTVKAIDAVLGQELKSLNRLRDNLNDFIKDNVVVLAGAE
jgi:hypothetical protein